MKECTGQVGHSARPREATMEAPLAKDDVAHCLQAAAPNRAQVDHSPPVTKHAPLVTAPSGLNVATTSRKNGLASCRWLSCFLPPLSGDEVTTNLPEEV
eukprot:103820-Amphidinium_carterae.1